MTKVDEKNAYSPIVTDFLNSIKYNPPLYEDTYEAARAELLKIQSYQSFLEDVQRNDYEDAHQTSRINEYSETFNEELEDKVSNISHRAEKK